MVATTAVLLLRADQEEEGEAGSRLLHQDPSGPEVNLVNCSMMDYHRLPYGAEAVAVVEVHQDFVGGAVDAHRAAADHWQREGEEEAVVVVEEEVAVWTTLRGMPYLARKLD